MADLTMDLRGAGLRHRPPPEVQEWWDRWRSSPRFKIPEPSRFDTDYLVFLLRSTTGGEK